MSWLKQLFRKSGPAMHWLAEEKWLKTDADIFVRAAFHGDRAVLEDMWSRGVDANAEAWWRGHALVAASRRGHPPIVAMLLGIGADPNLGDKDGDCHTPLSAAVSEGHEEIVRQLIAAGADVNKPCLVESPLEIARRRNYPAIEEFLKAAGGHEWLGPR